MQTCFKCGKVIPGKYTPGEIVFCKDCAQKWKVVTGSEHCVCCGTPIPEGGIICPLCAESVEHKL